MVLLAATTPAFTHADLNILHVMSLTYIFDEVCDFQKGTKCDIMPYPIFKDDQQYNSWYHKTHAMYRSSLQSSSQPH